MKNTYNGVLDFTARAVFPFRGVAKSQLYEGTLSYNGKTYRYQAPSLVELSIRFERIMRRLRKGAIK